MALSLRNPLIYFGIGLLGASGYAQRPSTLTTDGKFTEFPLPNPNSGPTTVSIAGKVERMRLDSIPFSKAV